ncbi:MAG: cell division protein FtsL [Gammaproteobacteria bacterium]|nr:cell division protein FtsL [Gammaproteobacteria bacterium]
MIAERLFAFALAVAALASALGVVQTKHQSRVEFNRLQSLHAERDAMDIDWGRLQLEQSTLAQHARIEEAAHRELGMVLPERPQLIRIGP